MSLYDKLSDLISASEQFGKADMNDVRAIADKLFTDEGVKPEWTLATAKDYAGETYFDVSICAEGELIVNETFYSLDEAKEYLNGYSNIVEA
jgi:hypothetical protein